MVAFKACMPVLPLLLFVHVQAGEDSKSQWVTHQPELKHSGNAQPPEDEGPKPDFNGTGDAFSDEDNFTTMFAAVLNATPGIDPAEVATPATLKECLLEGKDTRTLVASIKKGIEMILMKLGKKVRRGVYHIARTVDTLAKDATETCTAKGVGGLDELKEALSSLIAFTKDKGYLEYKPKKILKIAGIDCQLSGNKFVGEWLRNPPNITATGRALGEFVYAFKDASPPSESEPEDTSAQEDPPKNDL
mmetsp:Transcript_49350/g.86925  ORF Transcript_49350/g.86925 Transcript_49350/m.86925 type:complete len:247 (-) Transcript_49350:60-800(-)